ncbi:MAG: type III-B CRISPR-associated protein Cas10/Cmr2 [Candidatus Woesearchaeota archaeon]
MKYYTALTIGPIYKSLELAHKTRELWAASYIFSWFIENVIQNLIKNGITDNNFIVPYPEKDKSKVTEAGIFPDRFILRSESSLFDELNKSVNETINSLSNDISETIGENKGNVMEYLTNYIRLYTIETQLEENDNVVEKMNKYCANCELNSKYIPKDKQYFLNFLEKINESNIYKRVYNKGRFPSIIELSTKDLPLDYDFFDSLGDEDDTDIWEKVVEKAKADEFFDSLKSVHKYIAIVQADGDNVGKLIKEIYSKNPELIREFSKALSEFSIEAADEINNSGGLTVYAGGDDLLFIASVLYKSENVFSLINKIDNIFNKIVLENSNLKKIIGSMKQKPSMSYGVSITYYKYPMNEALEQARKLLFDVAKENKEEKNAIAWRVLMHSGSYFEGKFHKNTEFYQNFLKMSSIDDDKILTSVIYNIQSLKPLIKTIANDKSKLENYRKNFYNEQLHENYKDFLDYVVDIIHLAFNQNGSTTDKALDEVFSALKLVKFINRKLHE